MEKISFPPYVEIIWLEDVNAVQAKWTELHLSLEKFKEVTDAVMKMLLSHNSTIWIADQYDGEGVFNKKIIDFITNELVGDAVTNYGIKLVLTVAPRVKGISSLNTKRWLGDVQEMVDFTMASFATIEDCKQWIHDNK